MSRSTNISVLLVLLLLTGTVAGSPALAFTPPGDSNDAGMDWPGALDGRAADTAPARLWLRAGTFDPMADRTPLALGLEGSSSSGVYVVQFDGALSPTTGERLEALGASVLGYVPDDALVVRFPRASAVLAVALWKDVRWLCPWQDGWKVEPSLEGSSGPLDLGVIAWPGSGDLTGPLRAMGARVLLHQADTYVVRVDARLVPGLVRMEGVSWVEPWLRPVYFVDRAAVSVGARQASEGPLNPDGTAAWAYNRTYDSFTGLTGKSVTVDITDTGVDGSHSAFNGRLVRYTSLIATQPQWSDPLGHGTHVAGIVLGDGSYRSTEDQFYHDNFDGKYAGLAPGAYMIAQSLYGPNETFTYRNLTKWSVQNGAQISQNSWGTYWSGLWGNYTIVSRDYDNSTRDADWTTPGNQSILVVFAAGNSGLSGNNTLSTTAVAKNVLAVGATGNGKNVTGEQEVWLYSSRGWTDDGRIKPDLVAPGDDVTSTWALADNGATGNLPGDAGDHSYITYGGTSMAAPVVSGSAALVYDHLMTREGLSEPSPAVVKAILIASADHLPGYDWPSREQGWGRVNASRAVVETRTSNTELVDQTTKFNGVGQSQSYRYDVQAGTPLRVSLVWTDLPSEVYSGKMLINDLDLEVKSPSGQVYKGNVFGGGHSITGGSADDTNNVEMVYMDTPETGEWTVTVRSSQLPPVWGGGTQDYAVAVVGNVNKKFVDLAAQNLSVRALDAAEGDVVPIVFDLANLGNLPAPAVPWRLNIVDADGQIFEQLSSGFEDIAPRSGVRIYANWTAVRGEYTVKVIPNPLLSIAEESYQNNNASKSIFIKGFGVSGEVAEPSLDGMPGKDVNFTLEITNTGNTPDRFLLTRSVPPEGWNARLDVAYVDVNPGATKTAELIVSIPEGLAAWVTATVNVTVVSQGNSTHQVQLSTLTTVGEVLGMRLDMDALSINAAPGEEAVFDFSITNEGNTGDLYDASFWQQSGPSDGVTMELSRMSFTTDVGETVQGNFTVSLDPASVGDLPAGEKVTFILKVESRKSLGTISRSVTGSVVIQLLTAVDLVPPGLEEYPLMPGEEVDLIIDLVNKGNGAALVTPAMMAPGGWEFRSAEPSVYLETGQSKSLQVWVTAPGTADAGDHTVALRAMVGGKALDTEELTFSVDWLPAITVSLTGSPNRNLTQGQEVTFEFRVTNVGNGPDSVTVEFGGLSRGLTAESRPALRDLAKDEVGTFIVVFNASLDAELLAGNYRVTFSFAEGLDTRTYNLNITIEQRYIEPPPDDDDDDDGGGIPTWLIMAAVLAAVLVVVGVLLMTFAGRRRAEAKMEETFFKDTRREETTSSVLEDEMAHRRGPPPPPSEATAPPAPPADEWVDSGSGAAVAPAAEVAQAAPARGGACPSCGNAMQPLGPDGGMYCPMCGHQEGGQ